MNPVLYRYRNNESVIKAMDGYTPCEGWEPLYDQAAIDAAVAAERERCAKVCDAIAYEWRGANSQSVQCANAIRKGE